MGILDRILRKKKKIEEREMETKLPQDLERFRIERERPSIKNDEFHRFVRDFSSQNPERIPELKPLSIPEIRRDVEKQLELKEPKKIEEVDKLDLVLSKLETIDERLKRIEDKLERRVF